MRRDPRSTPPPSADTGRTPGFFSSYLWNSAAKLGDFGLAYVFAVLLARMLTPADYGAYATVLSLATLVFVLSSMGIDKTLHRFLGEFAATPGTHKAPTLVRTLLGIRVLLIVILVGAVVLGRDWIAVRYENAAIAPLILAGALYMVCQSLASFASNVLVGLLRTRTVGVLTVLFRGTNIAIAYVLLSRGAGVREIMVMLGITGTFLLLGYVWSIGRLLGDQGDTLEFRPILSFAASAWLLTAVGFGLGKQSDVIILNTIRHGQTEIAFYDIAFSLTHAVGTVLTIGLSGIALALFSRRQTRKPEGIGSLWRSVIALTGTVVIPLDVFLMANANACVVAIYGREYAAAGPLLLAYAAPMTIGWLLGGGASSTALQASHRIRKVLRVRVVTGMLNVAVNIVLVGRWGAAGALAGTGVCAMSAVLVETIMARRALGVEFPLRHIPYVVGAAGIALIPSAIWQPSGLGPLALHGAAFALLYGGLLMLLRPLPKLDEGLVAALPGQLRALIVHVSR
ncbi:oligosaccharide flippase family protein [bacterium]|nr:oligosaccharide flippase family protein [bacterium]